MARLPRPDLANVAQHIVQRGNNRLPCFVDDEDRRRYLAALRDSEPAPGSSEGSQSDTMDTELGV